MYRAISHVAIRVEDLQGAEDFYRQLFAMRVAFREAEQEDGWATLPEGATWEAVKTAGIQLGLVVLQRDAMTLALEQAQSPSGLAPDLLSHIGLEVGEADLEALREMVQSLACRVLVNRSKVLVFDDPFGVRWEVATVHELTSTGARTGRWIRLDGQ